MQLKKILKVICEEWPVMKLRLSSASAKRMVRTANSRRRSVMSLWGANIDGVRLQPCNRPVIGGAIDAIAQGIQGPGALVTAA